MLKRTFAARLAGIVGVLSLLAPPGSAAETRPNILVIVADDLGWQDVGWHDGGLFRTPVMDALVKTGVELDRHYVQPVCTPTRAALMSGRYPGRHGPQALTPSNLRALAPDTITMASALKSVGYTTYQAGKWHLGSRPEWSPNAFGFDHSYGSLTGAVDPWTHKYRAGLYEDTWHRDGKLIPGNEADRGNATELMAAQVVEWIKAGETARAPWFIYMPFHAVHTPVDAPAKYKAIYKGVKFHNDPVFNESRARLGAMVSQLDDKVGELVAALEATGQRQRTLIVFTSDNGGHPTPSNPYVGKTGPSPFNSSNKPLRGDKATLFEGGIRVAAFANWPGRLKPAKLTAPLHAVDWLPTIATLAGYEAPKNLRWDGQNILPLLTGEAQPPPRAIYVAYRNARALLDGDWKLIERDGQVPQLFHLSIDPYEKTNLAEKEPGRVARLRERLTELRKADVTELPADLVGIKP